ncbi:MAG TPA: MotA/TolQ/ExbB proton channel family protein [Fimbriiglobus sp.]|jgi:biopolymer transport protein ExbB
MNAIKHFYTEDWYFSIPMTIMTVVAFALVVWRFLLNRGSRTDMDGFMPVFQDTLTKKGVAAAIALCKEERGLIPNMLFAAGLEAAGQGNAAMRRSMASALELEILPRLNFLLAPILAIAKIATMVGLLGTVVSMINTFNAISEAKGDSAKVTGQAQSIGLALFATALGLLTAIPLVFSHVMFKDWIVRYETKMKGWSQKLIALVQSAKRGEG